MQADEDAVNLSGPEIPCSGKIPGNIALCNY
jgi:hypothetical protein